MTRLQVVLIALVLVLGGLTPIRTAQGELFAVGPVYSLRTDGTCQELTGSSFGTLAQNNSYWDAATKSVKLVATRNEEVSVQIIIPKPGQAFAGRMSDLKGPGIIAANRVTFSALVWIKNADGLFCPDHVIPLDGTVQNIRTFDVPVAFEGLPKAENSLGAMLVEIWVPKTTSPGLYKGTLGVLAGGTEIETLNLELTVFDFTMPDSPTFAFDLLEYGMPAEGLVLSAVLNGDGLGKPAMNVAKAFKEANYQIYQLAADNRCFINALPYSSQRGSPRFAPPIAGRGHRAKVMSWKEYDDLFAPILDGRCNKFGQPPAHFTLPFNVNYPHLCESEPQRQLDWRPFAGSLPEMPGVNPRLKEFEDTNFTIAQEFVRHFAERGWTRTRFEVFHNQKASPGQNRVPWKLDEPIEEADYRALRYLFNTAHVAFEGAAKEQVQVVTRLDIGHFHCDRLLTPLGEITKVYKAKQFDSHNARQYLKGCTDHWVIGITHAEGAQHLLADYDGPGQKLVHQFGS